MRMRATFAGLALALAASACQQPAIAAEATVNAPQAERVAKESGLKTAIFAGGCFWGVEAVFSHVKGVKSAVSGYHGGTERQASYDLVSSGITDHAEAVKITYDPKVIRYDQLLRIFFSVVADPTHSIARVRIPVPSIAAPSCRCRPNRMPSPRPISRS